MSGVLKDDGLFMAHVEDDREQGEAELVDIDDREEYYVKPLYTYYCTCGEMAMISDTLVARLPLRKRDSARVIAPERTTAKFFFAPGPTIYVKRSYGLEQQYRKLCKKCKVPLFYQNPANMAITFIFADALLSAQEVGGFSGNNEEQRAKKVVMKRNVKNFGKMGSVTVSTMENEDEDEQEARETEQNYTMNAKVVHEALKRKGMLHKKMTNTQEEFKEPIPKRRGTLL